METEPQKTWELWLFLLVIIAIPVLGAGFIGGMYWLSYLLGKETSDNFSETTRNFAWLFWMWLSATGAGCGLWLALRGRQIQQKQQDTQHKSHIQERFEKATDMLTNDVELARIGACRSLMNLGKEDESMKSQCVRLLFAFINNPYLEADEKGKELIILFSPHFPLRPDIQSAIRSFSAIYEHYGMDGIDDGGVNLPEYFWKNKNRWNISLIKAILWRMDLREACLVGANLQEVNLESGDLQWANLSCANLQDANLKGASLQGTNFWVASLQGANLKDANLENANFMSANISEADMREAKNLTRHAILSAKWGHDSSSQYSEPPKLPDDLLQDEEVKKWLETPAFDHRKKS